MKQKTINQAVSEAVCFSMTKHHAYQ